MIDVTKIFVKPAPGLLGRLHRVRNPVTKQWLPEEGAWVPIVDAWGRWWRRRIRDGSVVQATPPPTPMEQPEEKEYRAPKHEFKRKRTKKEE